MIILMQLQNPYSTPLIRLKKTNLTKTMGKTKKSFVNFKFRES